MTTGTNQQQKDVSGATLGSTCEVLGEDQGDQQDGDQHGADGDHAVEGQLELQLQEQRR